MCVCVCVCVPVAVAEPEPVEVMLHLSTINSVGWICWALGLAGEETESSRGDKLDQPGVPPTSWASSQASTKLYMLVGEISSMVELL